jgi:hypothetical protein
LSGKNLAQRPGATDGATLAPSRTLATSEGTALGLVIAAGFVLRIVGIHDIGFSADEAQFIYIAANESWESAWHSIVKRSPHPPANFALLHAMLPLGWNPLWLRLPSVLAGTFLIWMSHRFGRSLFGPVAGLAFAVLVAFSPGLLELSRVCRNYSLGFAFLLPAIHCLVRHLESGDRRPLVAFALLAPLAGIWHYGFVIAFIALTVVVAIEFLLQRRPLRDWIAVVVAHLPFAVTMGALYHHHISLMPEDLVQMHEVAYSSDLRFPLFDSVASFQRVWRYLELAPFAVIFGVLSIVGILGLLLKRRRLAFLVCVTPLVIALGFSVFGLIPLGGTRHSAYLFPFLFGPVAFVIGEIAYGSRNATRRSDGTAPPRSLVSVAGAALSVALGLWLFGAAVMDRAAEKKYTPMTPDGRRTELTVWYRIADIERGFALLERETRGGDLVVVGYQGLYAMRMYCHSTPPPRKRRRTGTSRRVRTFACNDVTYWYSDVSPIQSPAALLQLADRVIAAKRLPEPARIWTVQGGWEFPLGEQMRLFFPGVPFDASVERESGGTVFSIATADLRSAIAAKAATRPGRPHKTQPGR